MNTLEKSADYLIQWRVTSSNIERITNDINTLENTLEKNLTLVEDWTGAKRLLELLKNFKLEKRKDFILDVINSAMVDIFESDYRLDIQPRETKGTSTTSIQKYDIIFYQNGIEIGRNDALLNSNGGGVLSIASLFFKILIGYLYSKNKFYIFDESLSQVSPQYRGRLSKFLRQFCETYDFTLVIVSQTEELEEHAHLVYEVSSINNSNKIPTLVIDNVIGEIPEIEYFYSSLKNFQSVEDAKFIYKGFTIIRGPNNSGKSASLRAIDAILFNNFKPDLYPRKNPQGKKLTTEITFGYEGKSEITLKYKSNKVIFIIEGEEYFGKSLASEVLKEAVEEIGFRYIDVKSMYKSFKGPLKEQTERIAYTNQYDGLFLIGAKTSDSEKIFSFLFNTENIAVSIANTKDILVESIKLIKATEQDIFDNKDHLLELKTKLDKLIKLYSISLIKEYIDTVNEHEIKLGTISRLSLIINRYQLTVSILTYNNWFLNIDKLTSNTENQLKMISLIIKSNFEAVKNLQNLDYMLRISTITTTINATSDRISSIAQILNPLINVTLYLKYAKINTAYIKMETSITDINKEIIDLDNQYGIKPCGICSGKGMVIV